LFFLLVFASVIAIQLNMASRLSLGGFLAKAKAALTAPAAQRKGPLTFVVGNESAGKSSIISEKALTNNNRS
jgi:hypothetical protein